MVFTEMSKVWTFFSGLCPSLAALVDMGKDGPVLYPDAVGCAIRQESWIKMEKKVNPNANEGLNDTVESISGVWKLIRWWKIGIPTKEA